MRQKHIQKDLYKKILKVEEAQTTMRHLIERMARNLQRTRSFWEHGIGDALSNKEKDSQEH